MNSLERVEREQAIRRELDELYAADADHQIQTGYRSVYQRIHVLEQELEQLRRGEVAK